MSTRNQTPPLYKRFRTARQHKVCSLKTCVHRGEYGCMHCTCDGSCNMGHFNGQCGDIREGSQYQCQKAYCAHDITCTHSKRAVCYDCRRHRVSKSKASKKRPTQAICNQMAHQVPRTRTIKFEINKGGPLLPGVRLLGSIAYDEDVRSLKSLWNASISTTEGGVPYRGHRNYS